ncbi:MAG: AAA family ATPase [Gemmatimonadetes bacterium]|nr:AAA family ATPase [Gemmatimonadota bacterium]
MPTSDIKISVHNYKSLRHVTLPEEPFHVLVGPNAAGKSNIADALEFLSEVYSQGLENAVARKGGYENISFRRARRSRAAIEFSVSAQFKAPGFRGRFRIHHEFHFRAHGQAIQAGFEIVHEHLQVLYRPTPADLSFDAAQSDESQTTEFKPLFSLKRRVLPNHHTAVLDIQKEFEENSHPIIALQPALERIGRWGPEFEVADTELASSILARIFLPLRRFQETLGGIRVFQVSPHTSREPGVVTPNPNLGRHGENLPGVVSFLESHHPEAYKTIIGYFREIIPRLTGVEVSYTHRRTITLDFQEEDVGRPWVIDEVSDGTIQCLAILVAVLDPRRQFVMIEEPENSVHPWILRNIVDACRVASRNRQILISTHSPVLLNMLRLEELSIVSKSHGETSVSRIETLDTEVRSIWDRGEMSLYDLLDSGVISKAVPLSEPDEPLPKAP